MRHSYLKAKGVTRYSATPSPGVKANLTRLGYFILYYCVLELAKYLRFTWAFILAIMPIGSTS